MASSYSSQLKGSTSTTALALTTDPLSAWPDEYNDEGSSPDEKEDYIPEGFTSAEDFVRHAVEEYTADASYDRLNREAALDDLKFVAGEQWDPTVLASRTAQGRPCLTINVLPQFIGQVIGDRRINKTSIKIVPRKDATQEMADTRSGIVKSIEAYSRAERVYDSACEDQVTCGISNFRVDLDYADNDVFDQDIFLRHIPNPLAVVWDRMAVDPTGRDAGHCFVQDTMPRKVYEARWPDHPCPGEMGDGLGMSLASTGWFDKDSVRITEYWRLISKKRTLALMMDGKVEDITDMAPEQYRPRLYVDPNTGKPRVRRAMVTYANMHLITGFDILDGPYEVQLTRLPIIRVEGRVVRVGDDRVRYGLVRWAKDPQRLKNYWRSVAAETLALAPKAQWISPDDAVEGREEDFREAHKNGDPLLIYNKNSQVPPQRVDPPQMNAAAMQESAQQQQDIKDTTGLQDASLGVRTNEISGKAINARQREGDVATVIYHDNLNSAIQEGGDVVNQLIPVAYDTTRTLRVIGADDKHKLVKVNDPKDPDSPDITSGKYDVSVITGPSYSTQRMEAADAMMQAIQVAPQLMQIAGDLIVKAQDWPGATEIAERLKKTIPPQLLPDDDPDKPQPDPNAEPPPPPPEQMKAMQDIQIDGDKARMDAEKHQLDMARLVEEAEHAKGVRALEIRMKMAEITRTEAEAAASEASVPESHAKAREAQAKADRAEHETAHVVVGNAHAMELAERGASHKESMDKHRAAGSQPGAGRGKPAAPHKGKK